MNCFNGAGIYDGLCAFFVPSRFPQGPRWTVMTQETGVLTRGMIFALTALICLWGVQAMAVDGLTSIRSSHGPEDTMNRLEAEVKAKGMTVFARIDHAAGAAAVGLSLLPTDLLIFGNAKG